MKKFLWILGGCCAISLIIGLILIVIAIAYFSFSMGKFTMPDVGSLLSFNQAKDLGVAYTEADLQTGRAQTNVQFETIPSSDANKSIEFSGQKEISGTYTSETITAMINSATYKYYPLTNTQVLIHPDGTIETSGNLDINKVIRWAVDLNADPTVTGQIDSATTAITANPSFYLKGTMSVSNNQINLNVQEAQVSVIPIDQETINQYQQPLADFIEERIANVPNMNIRSADFSTGKLILDATYPAIEKTMK